MESGRDDAQEIVFEVRQVTDHIDRTLAPIAAAKQLAFAVEVDPAIAGPVLGDAHALNSVLMNLAGNAVKFTGAGSVLVDRALVGQDAEGVQIGSAACRARGCQIGLISVGGRSTKK